MNSKKYVTEEIAKKLKELGYNEECDFIWKRGLLLRLDGVHNERYEVDEDVFRAPDWNDVLEWLRRVHNINVSANMYICEDGFSYCSRAELKNEKEYKVEVLFSKAGFEAWEEAIAFGVKNVLENIARVVKKVLLIVDCQYDFVNPNGSLYVDGSVSLPHEIYQIMDRYDGFVFTMDAHPYNHCSFKEYGGEWPRHCVIYSKGASIPDILLGGVGDKPFLMLDKGNYVDEEAYGAFEKKGKGIILVDWIEYYFGMEAYVEIDVCGVAGDYCVYNTVEGLAKNNFEQISKINVLENLCPCINKDFKFLETVVGLQGVYVIEEKEN